MLFVEVGASGDKRNSWAWGFGRTMFCFSGSPFPFVVVLGWFFKLPDPDVVPDQKLDLLEGLHHVQTDRYVSYTFTPGGYFFDRVPNSRAVVRALCAARTKASRISVVSKFL